MFKKLLFNISFVISLILLSNNGVSALSGSDFNPGRIIDDVVFIDNNSMTTVQIQSFLEDMLDDSDQMTDGIKGSCDTNGNEPYAGTTKAAYGTSKGYPPPYICLTQYFENTTTKANNLNGTKPSGAISAAQIIKNASDAYNISPKVLIVTLQKENSLITDDWPWSTQYRTAMGYGCPDGGDCNSKYFGFYNQIENAAWQFRQYLNNPGGYNYDIGSNNILYNPNLSCGNSTVNIQNRATAALYNYTPYQPNQVALDNLYGSGNSCSAYGNRNFWRYFNDWFGFNSNLVSVPYTWNMGVSSAFIDPERSIKYTKQSISIEPGKKAYTRVIARNMGNKTWSNTNIRLGTFGPQDRTSIFQGSDWLGSTRPAKLIENSVLPGDYGTFEFELIAPDKTGTFVERFNLLAEGITWMKDQGLYLRINVTTKSELRNTKYKLSQGETLLPGEYLLSQDGYTVLELSKSGSLVLHNDFKIRKILYGSKGAILAMQSDGNLVLYDKDGHALWHTITPGNPGSFLTLKTEGNMVITNDSQQTLWASNTSEVPDLLYYVNPNISTGKIFPGQSLSTADKKYRMDLQSDGNLVIYSSNRAIWANYTTIGKSVAFLAMQSDGNLVIYDKNDKALWHTYTNGKGVSNLVMQPDGNLVIYNQSGRPSWHTRTYGME